MIRFAVKSLLLAALVILITVPAKSEIRLYGGKYDSPDNWFAGGGFRIGVLPIVDIIPNYEYVFVDHGSFSTLSVDGAINFLVVGYAGVGVAYNFSKAEGSDTRSNAAFNVLAGVNFKSIPLSPFLQFKWVTISEGSDTWSVGAGVHF